MYIIDNSLKVYDGKELLVNDRLLRWESLFRGLQVTFTCV